MLDKKLIPHPDNRNVLMGKNLCFQDGSLELQIRGGIEDNSVIFFHISQ